MPHVLETFLVFRSTMLQLTAKIKSPLGKNLQVQSWEIRVSKGFIKMRWAFLELGSSELKTLRIKIGRIFQITWRINRLFFVAFFRVRLWGKRSESFTYFLCWYRSVWRFEAILFEFFMDMSTFFVEENDRNKNIYGQYNFSEVNSI